MTLGNDHKSRNSCNADLFSCKNKMDFYNGYPHFFFGWPSPKLEQPIKQFFANMAEGIKFVLS